MNRIELAYADLMRVVSDEPSEKLELLEGLLKRNQRAYGTLIDRYHSRLLQLAMMFVPNEIEAEEVVEEMRVEILEGGRQDEGQSCLEMLIFQILTKRSKTREVQESWGESPHVH